MCGIIACKSDNVTEEILHIVYNLIAEAQIRGMHATGVSYKVGEQLKHIVEPLHSRAFLSKHWDEIKPDLIKNKSISLIAHTRYSTSDLEFNQPIYNINGSLVLNGVITQSPPEEWKDRFGVTCYGKNDTEILFHNIQDGNNPLYVEDKYTNEHGSMALAYLNTTGDIMIGRNGHRPGWYLNTNDMSIIASTKDIIRRATGSDLEPKLLDVNVLYELTSQSLLVMSGPVEEQEDWQSWILNNELQKDLRVNHR